MNTKKLFYIIVVLLLLASCGKDDGLEKMESKNNAPVIEVQSFSVPEDIMDRNIIGKIKAVDKDQDELIFNLVKNDNGLFRLASDGTLSLEKRKILDFEKSTEHKITISVTDKKEKAESEITISVNNISDSLAENPESFVTLWYIDSEYLELTIGTNISLFSYDYLVDWGDGTIEEIDHNGFISHEYSEAGTYRIAINGSFPHFFMGGDRVEYIHRRALIGLLQWGAIDWESLHYAFSGCFELENFATDTPKLGKVSDMSFMFSGINKLEGDFTQWDVTSVSNMKGMFSGTNFTADISSWNVENVKDMSSMFHNASSGNLDIESWNVKNVITMRNMFNRNQTFKGNLKNWDVSNVRNMRTMFWDTTSFNGDISHWDVDNVEEFDSMFSNAKEFDRNLGAWNIQNAESMRHMFNNSGMSPENYGATLVGWHNNINTPQNIELGAEGIEYCEDDNAVVTARSGLITDFGWTINGDSSVICN
ncbi:BspA family leucine-rich repeat surface protein [Flagellimonas marina]|uniref:BspA family leucine-rich repeat surface protein n=1 Tax=Flagellimonas marina TaxID=1775168 RepID=A0ABV8PL34_9FLAO